MKIPPSRFQLRGIVGDDTAHLHDSVLDRDHTLHLPRRLTRENFKILVPHILFTLHVTGFAEPEDTIVGVLSNGNHNGTSLPQ